MEAITLLGLVGLGYAVSKLKTSKAKEGFQVPENSINKGAPSNSSLGKNIQGNSIKGTSPELDQMYTTSGNHRYNSEPNPGPYGMPVSFATGISKRAPSPVPLEDSTAQVQLNPAGIQEDPIYENSDYTISPLSGEKIRSSEFRHNNMTPYFGGRVKQNMKGTANSDRLDRYTGAGTTQVKKKEVESMFKDSQAPYGNVYGLESSTDFVQSRLDMPRNHANEKPFEPIKVGPGLNEKFGSTGSGGFQQFELNDIMKKNMRTTDDLRVASKPKLSYEAVAIPGTHFITKSAEIGSLGEIRKNNPERFYEDQSGVSYGSVPTGTGVHKETTRPVQILPHTSRPETSVEYFPAATSQDYGQNYVSGSYRNPMTQQHGDTGFRNADMTDYYTNNTDSPEADYGRASFENKPNERNATSERVMGLNLAPSQEGQGATTIHYNDPVRPTRRSETVGNIRQTGTPTGFAGSSTPSMTIGWDPATATARTTVKETTINWNLLGIASPGSTPERLTVYDPEDIARQTQKSQLSRNSYVGAPMSASQGNMNQQFAYNMRKNSSKQVIAKARKPMGGEKALFTGNSSKQTAKRLPRDDVNERLNGANRLPGGLTPGVGDLGQIKYRAPLHLDVSAERLTPHMISALESNPLHVSLLG